MRNEGSRTSGRGGLLLALAAFGGALSLAGWALLQLNVETTPLLREASSTAPDPALDQYDVTIAPTPRALTDFKQSTSRPLFFANRRPVEAKVETPQVAAQAAPAAQPPKQLQLIGIVRTGKGPLRALIRGNADLPGTWMSVGEEIQGWQVREISETNAVIEAKGQRAELQLSTSGPATAAATPQ